MKKTEKKFAKDKSSKKKNSKIDEDIGLLIRSLKQQQTTQVSSKLKPKDSSELEEELKEKEIEEIDLQDNEFHETMRLSRTSEGTTPILERIASSGPRPIFVGMIPQGIQDSSESNEGDFKYVASSSEKKEPMYVDSSVNIYKEAERFDVEKSGRDRPTGFREFSQETFFRPDERMQSQGPEKTWRVDRFEVENSGRKLDEFERKEIKYEKYKPK